MKVAGKLILLFILGVIGVTALASHFTSKQFFANIEQRHQEIVKAMDAIQSDAEFADAIDSEDYVFFEKMVRRNSNEATQVRWVWFGQAVESRNRPALADQSALDEARQHVMSLTGMSSHGQRLFFTYCPVNLNGRIGAVEIASPLESVDSHTRRTWITALVTIAAMGLLSIGMVMTAGVRWIARPLDALTEKMRRVGEGDFSSDLDIKSRDELGQLGAAVNQMCDRLRQQQATIETETNQRIEAMEQLRHADRLKTVGQLAAGFAHEVGTPLNVVSGRASMILNGSGMPPEKIAEHARAIKDESERISSIIQKLLDFARRSPSRKSEGDLRDVVRHSAELIRPLAEKRQVQLKTELPDVPAEFKFDFNQLQQVLMNLIDNAVDASEQGQSVEVVLRKSQTPQAWAIEVIDHGPGITAEPDEVFQPFYTTKEVGSGTGLGLSIAHGIVEEHGGRIWFESNVGKTKFIVEFPG